jgi:protein-S-isoprenylcysteine O-methyltransferase Ste14
MSNGALLTLELPASRDDPVGMFIRRLIYSVITNVLVFGGGIMALAGTWHWWRAWVLLGVVLVATVWTMLGVFRDRQDLLEERMKPPIQKGQPLADKIVLMFFIAAFFGSIVFIPLEVFRFHWLGKPPKILSWLGLLMFIFGYALIALSMRENAFAAPVVRHQSERHQKVVDTGVYSKVRHPMYSGVVLLLVGMALWLQSSAGALMMIIPTTLLMIRILIEENFLKRELNGYAEYTKRVRWRLCPGLW